MTVGVAVAILAVAAMLVLGMAKASAAPGYSGGYGAGSGRPVIAGSPCYSPGEVGFSRGQPFECTRHVGEMYPHWHLDRRGTTGGYGTPPAGGGDCTGYGCTPTPTPTITVTPTRTPSPSPSASVSPTDTPSSGPSPSPSVSSTTTHTGGGGGTLPKTGVVAGTIAAFGALLFLAGAGLLIRTRRTYRREH